MNFDKYKCKYCNEILCNLLFNACDYISNNVFYIVQCGKCKLTSTEPKLSQQQLSKYYQNYRRDDGERFSIWVEKLLYIWHNRRPLAINKLKEPGNILDIGCGRGTELSILKKSGWNVYGTEYFILSKIDLVQKGINVFIGNFWDAKYKKSFFDVVTLWHVLEHLQNPQKIFVELNRIIKPNGILIIGVPNFDSWESRIFHESWFHLDVPRHQYHYSEKVLKKILNEYGFKIIKSNYIAPEYDFYSFWQSSLNYFFRYDEYLLYRVIKKEILLTNKIAFKLLTQIPILIIATIISLIFVPLSWFYKSSGTIEITAIKI